MDKLAIFITLFSGLCLFSAGYILGYGQLVPCGVSTVTEILGEQ